MMKTNIEYRKFKIVFAFFALFIGFISCKDEIQEDILFTGDDYENMMQYIDSNPDYSSFRDIVNAGKMNDALSAYNHNGGTGYTLFLPSNEAVALFIEESDRYASLDALLEDVFYCTEIVRFHLINGRTASNEFPNGALADKTISNYYLTIFFREDNGNVGYYVNDIAEVVLTDIVLSNGTVHVIDKMLTPVVFTSFEWVEQSDDFTIFSELLIKCGLEDTLNAFEPDELGREVYNEYTMFAESDELYLANGINSFEDLILRIDQEASVEDDFTLISSAVNNYARYHILTKSVFLDEFSSEVYNTYGDKPVAVDLDDILKINTGVDIFDSVLTGTDTLMVDYLQIEEENSNVVSKNGAIHQLDHLLYPFLPVRKTVTYQFYEEPVINALKNVEGTHNISAEELDYISLIGTQTLSYTNSSSDISGCTNNDYTEISGDVELTFVTPKILAGRYTLKLVAERGSSSYASIQALVDATKVGVVLDLTKDSQEFRTFTLGTVEFSSYGTHTVTLNTVIPGKLKLDRIIFAPIN